jgi:hypothetical protein
MFLLLPYDLQFCDLSKIVEVLLQSSGCPQSIYAAHIMLVVLTNIVLQFFRSPYS